eukprot:gene10594-14233_t
MLFRVSWFISLFSVALIRIDHSRGTEVKHSVECDAEMCFSEIIPNYSLPIIDIGSISAYSATNDKSFFCEDPFVLVTAKQIDEACRTIGFFYVVNHNVPLELIERLQELSTQFFKLPLEEKRTIAMSRGGKAWRGFFAVGDEVTSGIPDQKEGIYFGSELPSSDPRPLHGPNLWPEGTIGDEMKDIVLKYMKHMKTIGTLLMKAIGCSLHIKSDFFEKQFETPTELFRIFNYPPHNSIFGNTSMGVGEHTDYGYLTILKQDDINGGLQVRNVQNGEWIEAPPIINSFIINLGDALEHNTQGLYKATPHRVLQRVNTSNDRISMPYFFDPSFDALLTSIVPYLTPQDQEIIKNKKEEQKRNYIKDRWDKMDPALFQGTYGDYLLNKVSKAFPLLAKQQLSEN